MLQLETGLPVSQDKQLCSRAARARQLGAGRGQAGTAGVSGRGAGRLQQREGVRGKRGVGELDVRGRRGTGTLGVSGRRGVGARGAGRGRAGRAVWARDGCAGWASWASFGALCTCLSSGSVFGPGSTRYFPE